MPIRSVAELQQAIDTHGADIARWPAALRDDAAILIANSGEARHTMEAALKLDAAMRTGSAAKAPAGLIDRVMQTALQKRPPGSRS